MNINAPGLTVEQVAVRSEGVGASEAAAALGLSPRQTMGELWAIKTRRAPPIDDTAVLRLGNAIEPFIIGECVRDLGIKVYTAKPDTFRRERQIAHLDAITPAAVIEGKWRGSRDGWGEPKTSDIPTETLIQVMQQMDLAGLALAYVPVLFVRPPVAIYEVPFDVELAAMVREGVDRFWWHVEHDKAPPIDADGPRALETLRAIYKGTDGTRIQADGKLDNWRAVLQDANDIKSDYEKTANVAKAHLLRAMGEAAELEFRDGMVFRRKLVKRKGYAVADTEYIDARFSKPKE